MIKRMVYSVYLYIYIEIERLASINKSLVLCIKNITCLCEFEHIKDQKESSLSNTLSLLLNFDLLNLCTQEFFNKFLIVGLYSFRVQIKIWVVNIYNQT